ncbi:hypothetical protein DID88_001805 [Monilinia fructigena]|uniref:Plastocyanin-like domain-containing protein n=1 Tax=Monilinia fructigena TaxID=38457 RepID=A0A395IY16_9HELO|nr:hypothetical protein DID88_001805 [Monilinia fructigena]
MEFTRSECMLINGQFPGPTLYADWGDMIQVTVKNSLQHNGMVFIGMAFVNITHALKMVYLELPNVHWLLEIPSHFSGQYGEGIIGGLVINGPASANYDIDLGTYMVQDWYHTPVFALVGSYWFRAEVQAGCGSNTNNGNIRSIFTYAGANSTTPASTAAPSPDAVQTRQESYLLG